MLHGDGDIYLIYFENKDERFCYVVLQQDISTSDKFTGKLDEGRYYDWETPYGYGGPLADKAISDISQKLFEKEIKSYCQNNNIISQFVRFHPLLANENVIPDIIESRYMRETIYIDTSDNELIMKNMDTKNRNMVRKAKKEGVEIIFKPIDEFDNFIKMYNQTMKMKGADEYYTFRKGYFESLVQMNENAFIAYALYQGNVISGSIFFYNDRYIHYHLSGADWNYRKYSPNNLLLYETACRASKKGIKQFHLGGGMAENDSLFGFKKQFNKNGRVKFYVGRTVFDENAYNKLLEIRKESDSDFDMENLFMIQYRR